MFGRTHRPRRIAAIDHTQRIVLRRGGEVHLAHAPLLVERVGVRVPAAVQVVAGVALADGEDGRLGDLVVTEFQVQNPLREAVAPLAGR